MTVGTDENVNNLRKLQSVVLHVMITFHRSVKHTTVDEILLKCKYYYYRINKYKFQFHSVNGVQQHFLLSLSLLCPSPD